MVEILLLKVPGIIIRKWPSLKTIKKTNKNYIKEEINNNNLLIKEEEKEEEKEEIINKKQLNEEKLNLFSEIKENNYLNNNISIQKSFGEEINECLPFIDSNSSSSSVSSPFISSNKTKIIKKFSSSSKYLINLNKKQQSLPNSIETKRKILLENNNNFLLIYNQINSGFSHPNLIQTKINNNNGIIKENKIIKEHENKEEETLKIKLTKWLFGIIEWTRRNNSNKLNKKEEIEEQKSNTSTTCNRSIRISSFNNNNFLRSLLNSIEEKQCPSSKQLIKKATKQMRREQKATVTLAVVLVVFLCCWVPFFALHLSNALCLISGGQQCVHMLAMFLCTWLGYLNSSLNPLIYTVFDKRFRKAFRDLLSCCLGQNNTNISGIQRRRLK
ncbi:G_PROTEIN_RECEP_F1_2 domain-containing protein [Meloidogyne graminicola]|uniref:G_PROTEIN_RECEP_F1_2 domain-containing protein n=1 Tax=Meloidogyne graminicola TaxID=189291 RepID=A0A8S9ZJ23_9BILA|nr:G_PROTEIN_RECEP_F1_2 domain-containing protein [Meloidogyne graminicola]